MKHSAVIQSEFSKIARKWNDLTLDEQKRYLRKHPGSKRRITARPDSKQKQIDFHEMIGSKRIVKGVARLNKLMEKIKKNKYYITVPRAKVSWVLERALKGKLPNDNIKTYDLKESSYSEKQNRMQKKIVKALNRRVKKIAIAAEKLIDRQRAPKQAEKAIDNYIKQNFVVLRDAKTVKSVKQMEKFKAPKAKVLKSKKKPNWIETGHRVRLSNGVEGTVTGVKSGHKWVTVNVTTDEGQHWHTKLQSQSYGGRLKYLGKTADKDAKRIIDTRDDFEDARRNQGDIERTDGRSKIESMNIRVGDFVTIKGTHYNWTAEVMEIDYRQGGVRINQVRQRRQRSFLGLGQPIGRPHYRFIHAKYILNKKR